MQRTRSVLGAALILVLGFSSFAVARAGDPLLEGVRNGTATSETQIVGNIAGSSAATGGYTTRQSNLSSTGGGAIYGCRSSAAANTEPCLRVNNLSSGKAFEFHARGGPLGGTFTVGDGGDTKVPFTTNATGVAAGLNADRVDGQNAADIVTTARAKANLDADTVDGASAGALRTRWVRINEAGEIAAQSGGFNVVSAYAGANNNVYINSGEDLSDNGIQATIAIRNIDGTNFGGEISASQCQIAGVVNCVPEGTQSTQVFVVSPRNSDGTATAAGARKPFYATISE